MQGSTQPWDQPPDPRESTVSIPRVDPAGRSDQVSESGTAGYDSGTGLELPGFGDPYAIPARSAGPLPAPPPAPLGELPVKPERPAAPDSTAAPEREVTPDRTAAPVRTAAPELAVTPEVVAAPELVVTPEVVAAPERAQPLEVLAGRPPEVQPLEAPADQPAAISRRTTAQPPRLAVRRAAPASAGPPPPGSMAELRARLDRLPDGHPSSPYDDEGWLKPAPTRLRQLELGLPARSLGTPASYAERFGIDPDDDWMNDSPRWSTAAHPRPQTGSSATEELPEAAARPGEARSTTEDASAGASSVLSENERSLAAAPATEVLLVTPDLPPETPGPAPETPGPTPETPTRGTETPTLRIRPAATNGQREPGDGDSRLLSSRGTTPRTPPDELQHPYASAAEHDPGSNGSTAGDLALARWPAGKPAPDRRAEPAGYRNGHRPTANQPAAVRAELAGPDRQRRPSDPARDSHPRRGDSSAAARPRLAPEHRDLVDRVLAACRAAEGRNARGGYGSSGLTPAVRRIADQLPAGGLAPGSEADTLKPPDRLAARLARLIDRQPGRPPAEIAATISDGIRYAFTFSATDYNEGTLLVHRKLKAQGFDLEARRNQWDSREWKGVLTRWRDPAHGLAFEVQFHTSESWAVVKQTHDAYLRITDPATPAAERARLRARVAAAAATLSPPPGYQDISDFRVGAR